MIVLFVLSQLCKNEMVDDYVFVLSQICKNEMVDDSIIVLLQICKNEEVMKFTHTLQFENNKLKKLPKNINALQALQLCDVRNNTLTALPGTLFKVSALLPRSFVCLQNYLFVSRFCGLSSRPALCLQGNLSVFKTICLSLLGQWSVSNVVCLS